MIGAVATTFGVGLWPLLAVPVSLALVAGLLALLATAERWLATSGSAEDAAALLRRSVVDAHATEVPATQAVPAGQAGTLSAQQGEADLEPAIY